MGLLKIKNSISNLQTLYIWSSLLTTVSYGLFLLYGFFWNKQSGFEWMPPICFAAVLFFSSMGILPLPYIYLELIPKKVHRKLLIRMIQCICPYIHLIIIIYSLSLNFRFESQPLLSLPQLFGSKCSCMDPFFSH